MTTSLVKGRTGTATRARVLVVSGPQGATELTTALARLGHEVQEADSLEGAQVAISTGNYDVMFVDATRIGGLHHEATTPTILISDNPETPQPSHCLGVVPRNVSAATAAMLIGLVADLQTTRTRCNELEVLAAGIRDGSALVGRSPVVRRLQGSISRAADSDSTVLVEGEHGSGKSLAVRMIHCKSRRGNRPLVIHQAKSLDTDALSRAITEARGSTLLIEEIEQLPQASQQALVRNLKERASTPPSDTPPARIIATTTAHLPEMVARGSFREDLYYRLHMFPIVMPSLRERLDDIPVLVETLIAQCSSTNAIQRTANITGAALSTLASMNWPGNVAQLEAVIRRAFFTAGGHPIDREHIQVSLEAATKPVVTTSHGTTTTPEAEDEVTESSIVPFEKEEQRLLSRALQATRGNVRRAAQLLGIGRATLYRKIQQYQLRLH